MSNDHLRRWATQAGKIDGYIGEPGQEAFAHRFGGDSWRAIGDAISEEPPRLMVTLDLSDPRLQQLSAPLTELPLCSYLNDSTWYGRQDFQVDASQREERCAVCGKPMQYVASIGYESDPGIWIPNTALFYGEAALYFFLCRPCRITRTISQG